MQLDDAHRVMLVFTAAVDRMIVAIAGSLTDAGIEPIVMKGPTFARWLYDDGRRVYRDADLLVDPDEWERALEVLRRLGFVDSLAQMAHPRMESQCSWPLSRGHERVDLHASIAGLDAPPARVWRILRSHAQRFELDGRLLLGFDEVGRTMHVALHAAHHRCERKPREDLRRALGTVDHDTWAAARDLALELDGGPAFASGLRTLPAGASLARLIGVEGLRSVRDELRRAGIPTAEALSDLLAAPGMPACLRIIRAEFLPNAAFMRWNHELARRGRRGLVASYALRWVTVAASLPRGAIALARARRRVGRTARP